MHSSTVISSVGPVMSLVYGTIHLRRRHALGGEGCPPLPTFADGKGGGVLGMPTSTLYVIIEIILHAITLFYFGISN